MEPLKQDFSCEIYISDSIYGIYYESLLKIKKYILSTFFDIYNAKNDNTKRKPTRGENEKYPSIEIYKTSHANDQHDNTNLYFIILILDNNGKEYPALRNFLSKETLKVIVCNKYNAENELLKNDLIVNINPKNSISSITKLSTDLIVSFLSESQVSVDYEDLKSLTPNKFNYHHLSGTIKGNATLLPDEKTSTVNLKNFSIIFCMINLNCSISDKITAIDTYTDYIASMSKYINSLFIIDSSFSEIRSDFESSILLA